MSPFPVNFGGLNVASSALSAYHQWMNVIQNNITNVNTPGYSRQTAILTNGIPFPPIGYPMTQLPGQMGGGTQVSAITQFRLQSLEDIFRKQSADLGNLTGASQLLGQIQSVF